MSDRDIPDGFALDGKFNRENALTALAVLKVIGVDRASVERGFASVVWPGRFQKIVKDGKRFIVDGAHNPPAMRALVDSLKAEAAKSTEGFPVRSVICGFCGDKDVDSNLLLLREIAECGMAVPIRNPRSLAADATAGKMRDSGFHDVLACRSLEEALSAAPDGTVVCGSLFLAGEALESLSPSSVGNGHFVPNEHLR
jgi:dihydrofolate synthase/folylpolyglutamate synthase